MPGAYVYSTIDNENIKDELSDQLNITRDLMSSLDILYSTTSDNDSVSKMVSTQYAKLQVDADDLLKQIDNLSAQITAKETEFVDIKKNAGSTSSASKFFTQQDYFTAMLFIAYIILSMSFYWRMTAAEGFSWKITAFFLIGWMIATIMLFRLFDRFA
jgi:hypothetical protein